MKSKKVKIFFFVIAFLGLIIFIPGRMFVRHHVNQKTAVTDHPLKCTSCHLYTSKNKIVSNLINEDYYSPFNIAVSNDGKRLFVVAQDTGELLIVDAESKTVVQKVKVGVHPHSVILDKTNAFAYVSNQWSDNISVVNLATSKVLDTLITGNGPSGLALSADGAKLLVVDTYGSDLSVIDLDTKEEMKRLRTGSDPTGTALSPDGKKLYVTSRRSKIVPYGEPLVSDLTQIDATTLRVDEHKDVEEAYMMENITFTPSGDLALMTLIRPKNLIPSIQVEGGWMMTHGIGVIDQNNEGRIIQLLTDQPNAYYSDSFDIVVSPDGKRAYVSNAGADKITVMSVDSIRAIIKETPKEQLKNIANNLGVSSRFVIDRISTGANPKGLALSPDGKKLYIAEQLEDKIGVLNTETLKMETAIDLGGPTRITVARQGRRLFNNAGHTFQNQYACYTCHPDNHEDGLVYNMAGKDMGRNVTNTQSLREIGDTPPFKWNGKNQTIYKQDGMRFSTVLTRTEQFSYDDLDAITAYIKRGIKYPPNLMYNPHGKLTESQLRGKEIYNRTKDNSGNVIPENNRCYTCHPAPLYSNLQPADVSTLAVSDDSILFDTPHLGNIYASPPYLHDGRAATLEEIWTIYGEDNKHGYVNDLTKMQLNDLIDYLKSLGGPEQEDEGYQEQQTASF
ncbi:YncE family protein [Maribacter luteus]|uniref:Beta-propeller fold lactonase family protein n=1 Tax=Maribacter luteus TaxID=2594478 RepID=A0A6I2ML32_9FLAO|nr:YncE family protein [Maribacter luteus]MRX64513.1 beta-propeller fold lactonase family protein [Maribacter luteus]|tara:strand:- start:525 stop:2552 length:2028 start_codon:yes stop_codon:yes gene_type:complete